jgi:hypothetical protein
MLSEGGEKHWAIAKRVASIADDGPPICTSVLVEPGDPEVIWRAACNVFILAKNDFKMARSIFTGEKLSMWDLAVNLARVSVSQRNDQMAQTILVVSSKVNFECAAAIATIAVTNATLANAIMKIGNQVAWDVAKNLAIVAVDDQDLAGPLMMVGEKQNWQVPLLTPPSGASEK